jgi:surface carbohydrate biosynthesis protein
MSQLKENNKVFFIIDEKKRDLLQSEFIIKELKKKNFNPFIIQFNNLIEIDLNYLKNSIIIFPHFRINIRHYIIVLTFLYNCKIIINDTEGAGEKDGYYINRFLDKNKNYLSIVDQYWLWGSNQYNKLSKEIKRKTNFFVTGFFRVSPKFINFIKKKYTIKSNKNRKDVILVNTNFTVSNPKYSEGYKNEIKAMKDAHQNIQKGYLEHTFQQEKKFTNELIRIVNLFKNKQFIIRPHPFENEIRWRNIFRNNKNVKIFSNGDVSRQIIQCDLLIHNDCTTAVEAFFFKKKSICFNWIHNPKYDVLIPKKFSFQVKNFFELKKYINNLKYNKKKYFKIDRKYIGFYKNINNFFADPVDLAAHFITDNESRKKNFKTIFIFYIIKFYIIKLLIFIQLKKINNKIGKKIFLSDFKLLKKIFIKKKLLLFNDIKKN